MNDTSSNQALSDKAYEQVLRDLRLEPGAKLHEDPDRVECWQSYFALFRALADEQLLGGATESEDPLLCEAAE
jgi:hypothetical protein